MTNAAYLRHLGGLLRHYYAPEFREPLSEDLLSLATALEKRLRPIEASQLHARAAEARQRPVKLTLVWSMPRWQPLCEHLKACTTDADVAEKTSLTDATDMLP